MTNGKLASLQEMFAESVKPNEPLAPYTLLKVGGPAEILAHPRTVDELAKLVRHCYETEIPVRVLGSGGNILAPDSGVNGVVIRLTEPPFKTVTVEENVLKAGCGAALSALISQAARHGLAGLETFVGYPGTVGGALRCNVGDRTTDIGRQVSRVEVLDTEGQRHVRDRDYLRFAHGTSNLDDLVLVTAEFELEPDSESAIVKRMRKAWIQRKARQPFSFQAAARMFKNPRGLNASDLIEKADLLDTRVGGAEISERDANFVIVQPGTPARDVLSLIELIRSRVADKFDVELELDISLW